ncbi:MAG: alpha/beta fold hydrolase [Pseudomonadota bacterium]
MHLAAAAASYGQAMSLSALAGDGRFPWAEPARGEGRAAGRALAQAGAEGPAALGLEAARRLREMVEGVERYQGHPYRRRLEDPPALWRAGSARLLDYGRAPEAADPEGAPVLVVPSLVNRAWVLDLDGRRSLLRRLAGLGFRPLLMDWGDPEGAERGFDLSAYFRERLAPAAEAAAEAAGEAPAVLGYCMGGAFAAGLAARRPELVARLALIGAPWDFSRLQGLGAALPALAQAEEAALRARIAGMGEMLGAVPVDLLQLLFAALDPTLALRKFRRFARMPEGEAAERFVATEDWLNAGPALAAPAAAEIAAGWYLENRTARNLWRLDGVPVAPGAIDRPALAFCSASDRIAPPPCAEALARAIPGARLRRPRTGHVGMIVGSAAPREVWDPLARFLAEGRKVRLAGDPGS